MVHSYDFIETLQMGNLAMYVHTYVLHMLKYVCMYVHSFKSQKHNM